VLVLYGSVREQSRSRLVALEAARVLHQLGCRVRVFNPSGLPVRGPVQQGTNEFSRVLELRQLASWSEAQVWVAPEQHGGMSAAMKNQLDWLPQPSGPCAEEEGEIDDGLDAGALTSGKALAVAQISGGVGLSYNTVNQMRQSARWLGMVTVPGQLCVAAAWRALDSDGRLVGERERLARLMEELVRIGYRLSRTALPAAHDSRT